MKVQKSKEVDTLSDNWVVENLQNTLGIWNEKLAEIWSLLTAWNDRVRITYEINEPFNVAKIEKITKVVTLNGFFRCFILNNSIGPIFFRRLVNLKLIIYHYGNLRTQPMAQ